MIIDAWAQHPTLRHSQDRIFASLRRWTKAPVPTEPMPVSATLAAMDQVALDFPELAVVGGHIGCPWTDEAIAVASKHENVYIDASAYTARRYPLALIEFMRGHGRHKLLFGTNWPMIAPAKALDGLDTLGLDEEARARFLSGNARRVFALDR